MTTLLGIIAVATSIIFVFSDKIIEHYLPESKLAQLSDEIDEVLINVEDKDQRHTLEKY
jgi:hypothetical protein